MKRKISFILSVFVLASLFSLSVQADSSETAQVIRADKDTSDLIVERQNGERWLLQHNRVCSNMTPDFPVTLIWSGDKIIKLKVNFNEQCQVYRAVPYGGEGVLNKLIKSENLIIADHEAEVTWDNQKYKIDYQNCRYFYDYVAKKIYFHFTDGRKKEGGIILPGNGGECPFRFTETLEKLPDASADAPPALEGIMHQAQNNQIYFYWDKPAIEGKVIYLISYSKKRFKPEEYENYKDLPNMKFSTTNSYTVTRLANGQTYYFYLAVRNEKGLIGPWKEVVSAPVKDPKARLENNPDPEAFEVLVEEKEKEFRLYWPKKEKTRRHYVEFYVSGKKEFFKILKPEITEILIEKKPEYLGKGLKFTVRTIPLRDYQPRFTDGIYWEYKKNQ